MRGSNASQKMPIAKRDRRPYRLQNENIHEKICRRAKNRDGCRQRQSGAAENRAEGLTARRCDVGLTSMCFDAVGSIDVDCGWRLYNDLVKAQQSLVVANHLHLLFLSTPYDLVADIKPNWMIYLHEASTYCSFKVLDTHKK